MQLAEMGVRSPWQFEIFITCLLFSSGSCISEEPPSFVLTSKNVVIDVEKRVLLLSSVSSPQLDDVPIVNPTTPGSANLSPSAPTSPQGPLIIGPNPTNSAPQTPATPQGPFMTGPDPTNTAPQTPTSPQVPFITGPNPTNAAPQTPTSPQVPFITGPNPTNAAPQTPTSPQVPFITGPNPTNSAPQTPNYNTPTTTTPSSSGGSWCIASPTASPTALQVALDYACGYGGADCSAIQSGGSCYQPNTVRDHASYAFNDFYQKHPSPTGCSFGGAAQLTNADPSQGNCHFGSSASQSTTPPTVQSPPDLGMPAAPVTPTTPTTAMPGGPSGFGLEPTGSFSSATSISYSISLIIFTTILLWDPLVSESYV